MRSREVDNARRSLVPEEYRVSSAGWIYRIIGGEVFYPFGGDTGVEHIRALSRRALHCDGVLQRETADRIAFLTSNSNLGRRGGQPNQARLKL